MPTYEYKCLNCENQFEVFQSIKASPIEKCPECSGNVKKLISAGGTPIFKGSGFYQTDYKNLSTPNISEKSKKATPAKTSESKSKEDLG